MGGEFAAGHFTSAPYFMSYDSPENHKFVEAFQKRWGKGKVTNFVSEPAYFQVYLFKQAVAKLGVQRHPPACHPQGSMGPDSSRRPKGW